MNESITLAALNVNDYRFRLIVKVTHDTYPCSYPTTDLINAGDVLVIRDGSRAYEQEADGRMIRSTGPDLCDYYCDEERRYLVARPPIVDGSWIKASASILRNASISGNELIVWRQRSSFWRGESEDPAEQEAEVQRGIEAWRGHVADIAHGYLWPLNSETVLEVTRPDGATEDVQVDACGLGWWEIGTSAEDIVRSSGIAHIPDSPGAMVQLRREIGLWLDDKRVAMDRSMQTWADADRAVSGAVGA